MHGKVLSESESVFDILSFDTSVLTQGPYLVIIKEGEKNYTRKVIKIFR
jgi:hypothetical protein